MNGCRCPPQGAAYPPQVAAYPRTTLAPEVSAGTVPSQVIKLSPRREVTWSRAHVVGGVGPSSLAAEWTHRRPSDPVSPS